MDHPSQCKRLGFWISKREARKALFRKWYKGYFSSRRTKWCAQHGGYHLVGKEVTHSPLHWEST